MRISDGSSDVCSSDLVVVSDVGSVKGSILDDLRAVLPPGVAIVPGHPVAGTENSGPDAGFAQLFHNRGCILTPDERTEAFAVRSEERRVGKEGVSQGRSRWAPGHEKKKKTKQR